MVAAQAAKVEMTKVWVWMTLRGEQVLSAIL